MNFGAGRSLARCPDPARHAGQDQDIAYTVGLFHGIGMVAIDEWAYVHNPELRFATNSLPLETCEQERRVLGFHNAETGAALLRLWEFPNVMSEPLRWQYLPRGTSAHFPLSSLLYVAKWLRTAVCQNTTSLPPPENALLRSLNLTKVQLFELIDVVRTRITEVNVLLEIDPSDQTEVLATDESSGVTFNQG